MFESLPTHAHPVLHFNSRHCFDSVAGVVGFDACAAQTLHSPCVTIAASIAFLGLSHALAHALTWCLFVCLCVCVYVCVCMCVYVCVFRLSTCHHDHVGCGAMNVNGRTLSTRFQITFSTNHTGSSTNSLQDSGLKPFSSFFFLSLSLC